MQPKPRLSEHPRQLAGASVGPSSSLASPVPHPRHPHFIVCVTLFSPDMCLIAPWAGQGRAGPAAWPREPGWHRGQAVGQGWLPER